MGNFISHNTFIDKYIEPFDDLYYIYNDLGYIVWRFGTGENVELLHIRTRRRKMGYGRKLFCLMLRDLKYNQPYYSIFGFTNVDNEEAKSFYFALGFNLYQIDDLYKAGSCILFCQSYEHLLRINYYESRY